ncbi:hypothetical protein PRK78_002149 [Emydomyces testavorans]|uniref:RTA1-like protein n=1 Tax=Emydomyces testavorans TaxID=2070801 RepID=A0AAF0DDN6_9EURO|nr:hypothetical protein PRK78_002149 [Emydomyces testavorans]
MQLQSILKLILLLLWSVGIAASTPLRTPAPSYRAVQRDAIPNPENPTTTTKDFDPHVSIAPVSVPPVSIPPVSIPSLSLDLPSNTCTPTIAPDKNGFVPPTECNALYLYYPSFAAALVFTGLFFIVFCGHFVQATVFKVKFVWVILMGSLWEFGGFLTRALSTRDQQNSTLATIAQLLILLAPLWVNAFDYMVLARMINFFIPDRRIGIFKPALLAKLFVFLDFGAFVIQLVGGSMAGPGQSQDAIMRGIHIYMGGIGIQEFFIVLFLVLAIQFHRQALHLERRGVLVGPKTQWRKLLYALYASLLAITVRIIFRLVEFANGNEPSNPLPFHEWYVYAFDATPMLVATVIWNVVHPGAVLQGPDAKMPPSGLRRLCCSCCGRRKHKNMHKLPEGDPAEEMRPFRGASPPPYK